MGKDGHHMRSHVVDKDSFLTYQSPFTLIFYQKRKNLILGSMSLSVLPKLFKN